MVATWWIVVLGCFFLFLFFLNPVNVIGTRLHG